MGKDTEAGAIAFSAKTVNRQEAAGNRTLLSPLVSKGMETTFTHLIRFRETGGTVHYGEASSLDNIIGSVVSVYEGDEPWSLRATEEKAVVLQLLCPLTCVPLIYGVGLNYKKHIEEAKLPVTGFPVIFTKPNDALAGPYDDIPVESQCLEMDYEGELCVIIGQDVKNFVPGEDPSKYVLGYAVGNDLSSRYWQKPERCGGQHGMAKSFDKFAPLGPVLVSGKAPTIADKIVDGIPNLTLTTRVNGQERQHANTEDLLFRMTELLKYLSMGRTLRRGTIIMTGTPSGVAAFLQPPQWLLAGDVAEVEIESLGVIRNKIVNA